MERNDGITTTQGVQGICPVGWHLPTDEEWTTLTDFLGGTNVAGGKMKETGTIHWNSPNTGASNESGFTALSSSYRSLNGNFPGLGNYGFFWSSSKNNNYAWDRSLYYNNTNVLSYNNYMSCGFSIRCMHD